MTVEIEVTRLQISSPARKSFANPFLESARNVEYRWVGGAEGGRGRMRQPGTRRARQCGQTMSEKPCPHRSHDRRPRYSPICKYRPLLPRAYLGGQQGVQPGGAGVHCHHCAQFVRFFLFLFFMLCQHSPPPTPYPPPEHSDSKIPSLC